jgi:hypothetical protein
MASSAAFLLALSLLAPFLHCCHGQEDGGNGVTAIYSLGDSITDTGNLVKEAPPGMFETIKHFPYGVTLGTPTGRCSDGLLMIDFLGTPVVSRLNTSDVFHYCNQKKKIVSSDMH